ncbi:NAD(P)-binding protein [Sphingomonas sp. TX0543]|uniref:NAD(P)-binding protein n=1 Tax=Sphingomonas sp. TX0543 TaxID=3399682 RepID=UPI003AFA4126
MSDGIVRRDFLNGVAIAITGAATGCTRHSASSAAAPYPPAKTGLRGSHPGSFETAHRVRDGERFELDPMPVSERYDLVVVGAGISGLAAAFFHHRARPNDRILVLDTNDDFGGHAKRNEFDVDGRKLLGYGGTQSIESPRSTYSPVAAGLLRELGVDITRFDTAFDRKFYRNAGLRTATFFARERYGEDRLVLGPPPEAYGAGDPEMAAAQPEALRPVLDHYPLPPESKARVIAIETSGRDPLAGKSDAEKRRIIRSTSYADFLRRYWDADDLVLSVYRQRLLGIWVSSLEGVSAASAFNTGLPGGQGLKLDAHETNEEPYIYHFPDGNASIARMLVRRLIPGIAPGTTMTDIVTAPFDYLALDRPANPVRIRLSSTAVRVRNRAGRVDVGYMRAGKLARVEAKACVLACYNMMIPYILDDVPEAQRAALAMNVKAPLVYINVAQRNWHAWKKLGASSIANPAGKIASMSLDFPVSLGDYHFARTPDDPIVSHHLMVPLIEDAGMDMRTQFRLSRQKVYEMHFADYEQALRDEMTRILGPGGFDFNRDVAAVTVNRWPHGYSYTPDSLNDDPAEQEVRMNTARRPVGRVAIANSDAGWNAYTNVAIDEAWRAVNQLWHAPDGAAATA